VFSACSFHQSRSAKRATAGEVRVSDRTLVVIAIIAILAAIPLPQSLRAQVRENARRTTRMSNLKQLGIADNHVTPRITDERFEMAQNRQLPAIGWIISIRALRRGGL